ncbi:hypothetical protein [Paenibacillus puerhi]|uniref:hypothetical protein n=1 Tax=Paenibacillus puerhi TaxID=2692622 RepID=UPI00135CBBF0|nr:hypothetical protein [Paenibacillus puerhi]
MKKEELLDILTHDRKTPIKLRRRAILKRVFAFLAVGLGLLLIISLIKFLVLGVTLQSSKMNYREFLLIVGWFISIIGLIISDSYNPLTKIKGFNNQFFVLIELVISEIESKKRTRFNLNELIMLFKRYLHNMNDHAKSLYIFESSDISSVTSRLSNIPYSKFHSLIDNNQEQILAFFKSLNSQYENKINDRAVVEKEYAILLDYINQINNYTPVNPDKMKWISEIFEFLKRKKKGILISLIVFFAIVGILLDLLGVSDLKYVKYFAYITGAIGLILSVLSSKDKE